MNIVEMPTTSLLDIPKQLRNLADRIESCEYGNVYQVAWVLHNGEPPVHVGLYGPSAKPTAEGHFLFALAMRELEKID